MLEVPGKTIPVKECFGWKIVVMTDTQDNCVGQYGSVSPLSYHQFEAPAGVIKFNLQKLETRANFLTVIHFFLLNIIIV